MLVKSGSPPPAFPLLERLVVKVESLESMLDKLFSRDLPSLEGKVDALRQLLTSRRKDLYTVEEVADLTGRTPYTVRRWIGEKRIKATRISGTGPKGRLLIPREEVEALIAAGLGARVPEAVLG
jgi:excisionase family DNA binding protein